MKEGDGVGTWWDDKFTSNKVGPSVAVSLRISNHKLVCDWSPEPAQWEDP